MLQIGRRNAESEGSMTDHNQDDDIESLYKPDWVALSIAVAITTISLAAFAFLVGYLT